LARKLSEKKNDIAMLNVQAAGLNVQKADIELDQQRLLNAAAGQELRAAQQELRAFYARCRRWGINPLANRAKQPISDVALVGVLEPLHDIERRLAHREVIDRAIEGLIGELRWIRFLRIPCPPKFVIEHLDDLAQLSMRRDINTVFSELRMINIRLTRKVADAKLTVEPRTSGTDIVKGTNVNTGRGITWLDPDRQDEARIEAVLPLPENLRDKAIGYFVHVFGSNNGIGLQTESYQNSPNTPPTLPADDKSDCYLVVNHATIFLRQQPPTGVAANILQFLVIEQGPAMPNPESSVASTIRFYPVNTSTTGVVGRQVIEPLSIQNHLNTVAELVNGRWKDVQFSGAYGRRAVFLFENGFDKRTERDRAKRIEFLNPSYSPENLR